VQQLNAIAENIAWIAGIVYSTIPAFWLVVHPFARFWREKRGKIYPLLGLIWLAMWIGAGWVTAPYRHDRLWPEWSWIGWLMLLALGISVYHRIGSSFGRNKLLGQAELRPQEHEQKLVTSGMHAHVRHPIYLAHWLMLTAWTVGAGSVALVALWCFAVITGVGVIFFEDRELEGRFGEEYRRYKQQVPAIIPKR
jgi:protein-S-isoprenylcysteine O-methyltransferase Ste14